MFMIEVYKYGGNILKEESNRKKIYQIFRNKIKKGIKIFMVVSAFGREKDSFSTDNLAKNLELLNNRDKDKVMTFGEIYSSLIMKNELLREGVKVSSADYDEIGIMCDNNYQDGNILGIDMSYLSELIDKNEVVIVPGFIAESMEGKIISLGRNTSDLTAIIIGNYFKVDKVNIIKEVDGVYKKDPGTEKTNKKINNLSYDEMISIINAGSKMFALKSLEYAKDENVIIEVKRLNEDSGTIISKEESKEKILFVNTKDNTTKIVFKGMDVFNDIFKNIVNEKIKLEELVINKDILSLKGNSELVNSIVSKYL